MMMMVMMMILPDKVWAGTWAAAWKPRFARFSQSWVSKLFWSLDSFGKAVSIPRVVSSHISHQPMHGCSIGAIGGSLQAPGLQGERASAWRRSVPDPVVDSRVRGPRANEVGSFLGWRVGQRRRERRPDGGGGSLRDRVGRGTSTCEYLRPWKRSRASIRPAGIEGRTGKLDLVSTLNSRPMKHCQLPV